MSVMKADRVFGQLWLGDPAGDGIPRIVSPHSCSVSKMGGGDTGDMVGDTFEAVGELNGRAGLDRYRRFVQGLVDAGEVEIGTVRRRVVKFYEEDDSD